MFNAHRVWSNSLSVRNLILLFFTIVLGFASVITLAQINIPSSIDNAWQTIAKTTITEFGTNTSPLIEMSSWGIFIDTVILNQETSFSWKVLWIDDNGNVIYVLSQSLVTSWGGGMGWWTGDGHWTGAGSDIYNINAGNVGINTQTMSGKLHITSSAQTELYLQESNVWNAANINFQNTIRTRALWWDSNPDIFYIWPSNGPRYFSIMPTGNVGIGSWNINPKANLQVVGTFIAGDYDNNISGANSSIAWWQTNNLIWDNSFIWWGYSNDIIWQNYSSIVWWNGNIISLWMYNSMVWWFNNQIISSQNWFIGWGQWNTITWSSDWSVIPGGQNNKIENSIRSFAGGYWAQIINTSNTFLRNSDSFLFQSIKRGTFIINVPFVWWGDPKGWVGINTADPKWELHVWGNGVVVLEPQINNPQWINAVKSFCNVTGSIVYNQTWNKLCYCDWGERLYVYDNNSCSF